MSTRMLVLMSSSMPWLLWEISISMTHLTCEGRSFALQLVFLCYIHVKSFLLLMWSYVWKQCAIGTRVRSFFFFFNKLATWWWSSFIECIEELRYYADAMNWTPMWKSEDTWVITKVTTTVVQSNNGETILNAAFLKLIQRWHLCSLTVFFPPLLKCRELNQYVNFNQSFYPSIGTSTFLMYRVATSD